MQATFRGNNKAKDLASTFSKAFKAAYENALDKDQFVGKKFGSTVEALVEKMLRKVTEGEIIINFDTLFKSIVESSKKKLYHKEMHGEAKTAFKTLANNNFEERINI